MGSIKEIRFELGVAEDLTSDQERLIQEAQKLYADIIAISTRLLPIAGKMSVNQKKALSLVPKAKELGVDDLVKKLESIGNNNLSSNVIKSSDSITSSAKAYKL